MNTTLTIQTPKKLHDDAKKTAEMLGVPLTTAMNAMLKQFIRDHKPVLEEECSFPSHTPNAETRRAIRNVQQRKNLKKFDTFEDFRAYVRSI